MQEINRNAVVLRSPGSRSAPWVAAHPGLTNVRTGSTATRLYFEAQGRAAHPGLPVYHTNEPQRGSTFRTQGALRDPGLWNSTALRLFCYTLKGDSGSDPNEKRPPPSELKVGDPCGTRGTRSSYRRVRGAMLPRFELERSMTAWHRPGPPQSDSGQVPSRRPWGCPCLRSSA